MNLERWFVYCLTGDQNQEHIPQAGIGGVKLSIISCGEIAAVASPLPPTESLKLSKEASKEYLRVYQSINNSIFNQSTIVPVKFGTIARSENEIEELLKETCLQVRAALARLHGKAEFVVLACWDLPKLFQEIREEMEAEHSEFRRADLELQFGKVFETMETKKKAMTENIHRALYPLASDFADGRLPSQDILFHRSYLLQRDRERILDDAMAVIGRSFPEYVALKYVGPIPPYSFTNLKVTRSNFRLLNDARKTLGVPVTASFKEIKAAYKKLSLQHHPDKNPCDPAAQERFRKVADAYQLLKAYCMANGANDGDEKHSFNREEVKKQIIVTTRGTA